jgi:ferritin-like metal-binding protein YciE
MEPLKKLFWEEVSEMLHVEGMLLKALLRMQTAIRGETLKEEIDAYREHARVHVDEIKEMLERFELPLREKKCDAMMGLLLKGQHLLQRSGTGAVLDAAILSVCRKINSYKVASYSSLQSWAKIILPEEPAVLTALKELLQNETAAAARFTKLAAEYDLAASRQLMDVTPRRNTTSVKRVNAVAEVPRWQQW